MLLARPCHVNRDHRDKPGDDDEVTIRNGANRRAKVVKKNRVKRLVQSRDEVRRDPTSEPEAAEASVTFALGREMFAKISEVEGIRLSDEAKQAFAEFDAQ